MQPITTRISECGYEAPVLAPVSAAPRCDLQNPDEIRAAIFRAESAMRALPQVAIEPIHTFAQGLYSRAILIPKGTLLTGKVHKQDDLQIMISGDISVQTPDGFRRLVGYNQFPSKAGTKQIGFAHEDTLWVTVHASAETDLDALEIQLFEDEPKVLDFKTGHPLTIQGDYYKVLEEAKIKHETAWAQSCNEADRIDIELSGVEVHPSQIHGLGVFSTQHFSVCQIIGKARIGGLRTQLGRYTNHHPDPNAYFDFCGADIHLIAQKPIHQGDEITVNYRQALSLSGIPLEAL